MKKKRKQKTRKQNLLKKENFGIILVLLTAIVSGFSIVANKFFIVSIDPFVFTGLRAFFIGWIFLIISLFSCKFNLKKFNKVSWGYLLVIGIIGGGLAFIFFFTGLKETTAGTAAFLQKTLPIFAAILAFFFLKEKITKRQIFAMIVMIVGVLAIESSKISFNAKIGDVLVLFATFLWAIENTISKKAMTDKESNWVVTFSRMFFGSLVIFGMILLTKKEDLLFSLTFQQIIYIAVSGFLLLLYVLFWYWGLKYINLSKASTLLLIAPIISMVLGYFWLGEHVSLIQVMGSAAILIGAYFIAKTKSEKRIQEI